ncbi:MAG: L-glutamate gamma-semialdehyde dehydrogenase [Crocinitomicaceae bacterium TMED114]|nr:MAG: L-glutamate gamma-semialdehyde dehydrogenase [Crocinitomicaceae bacterium TMED114]
MPNAFFQVPYPENEPVLSYGPGSPEREAQLAEYERMLNQEPVSVPMVIGGRNVTTDDHRPLTPPHDHQRVIGHAHFGTADHVRAAIDAALEARTGWAALSWEQRASIFLRAAEMLAGPWRTRINAATMLGQGKNLHQAEIDAACEFIDFLRFNCHFAQEIYAQQPESAPGIWNRLEYRALEGFVFAITPFNFTAIAGNLPISAALMGNVVVWKPSDEQIYSAHVIMELLHEAGLPEGVINLVTVDGPVAGDVVFNHPDFSGLHFTGSTGVFRHLWKTIGENIANYKTYPRIVGETGGKDFILAHRSANADEVVTGIVRGAFEFQGQKCSAASRVYLPDNLWPEIQEKLVAEVGTLKVGTPGDPTNFVGAVISRRSFDKIQGYIDFARNSDDAEILCGGGCDDSVGYFVEPTVVLAKTPHFKTMEEEIFGPVVTLYVYPADDFDAALEMVDSTSEYALTGAVFARERYAIDDAMRALENAAGNFYINDKPTGAVVGQQPFGGARGSGTNDKAGSYLNLLRWVSPRTIKETLTPPRNYRYPFHQN